MNETPKLNHPWLVAVWPGMGHVALNAGIYLLSKLGMKPMAEVAADGLFDVEGVQVNEGLIQAPRQPRNRFYVRTDPNEKHDLVLVIGEAQPNAGRYAFSRQLIAFAKDLGVERVFTFAAMATQMHPSAESRVFGAATDKANLDELKRLELQVLNDGNIGGLNGVLLAAAAEAGIQGACMLGEMPHVFAQVPFPKASHAILEAFTTLAGIEIDLTELRDQGRAIEEQLGNILTRAEEQYRQLESAQEADETEDEEGAETEGPTAAVEDGPAPEPGTVPPPRRPSVRPEVEALFEEVAKDRSRASELKQKLDLLGVFKEYEDRFLDLFRKSG